MSDRIAEYEALFVLCDQKAKELAGGKPALERHLREQHARVAMRQLCQTDLFYLMAFVCKRKDIRHQWLFERCQEVQQHPNGYLDLWAREHGKSSIVTFGKTIQDILNNPEITCGIFSHTKPIARGFLLQIKRELEENETLKNLYPEILWADAKKEAPAAGVSWSEEKGITVKRKSNPKESTVEAHGVVDGQPTSRHFSLLIYDDIVTLESVSTPDQIKKTTDALALSYNLGAHGGQRRFIGTRYHFNDTYRTLMDRGTVTPRIHPATSDGTEDGEPVLLTTEALQQKRRDQGPYVFGCQQLLNPKADAIQGFEENWLSYYEIEPDLRDMNIYIVADPANEKKKGSDYTVMWVIGLGADRNYYILDCVHDRLNLTERSAALFRLHMDYRPNGTGYEHYGMQGDIQHIQSEMEHLNYRFNIMPLSGATPKHDRIRRLVPLFEQGRIWLPRQLWKTSYEGRKVNIIEEFIKSEFLAFPVCLHDDMLDCLANIVHPQMVTIWPQAPQRDKRKSWRERLAQHNAGSVSRPKGMMAS